MQKAWENISVVVFSKCPDTVAERWAAVTAAKGGQAKYLSQEWRKPAGVTSALIFVVLSNHPYVYHKHYEMKLCFGGKK